MLAAAGAGLLQYAGRLVGDRLLGAELAVVVAVLLGMGVPRLLPTGTFRLGRGLPTVMALRGLLAGAFFGAKAFLPLMLVQQRALATTLAGASLTGAALTWSPGLELSAPREQAPTRRHCRSATPSGRSSCSAWPAP